MAGIPIAGAILGGIAGYKDAKAAKKEAKKGIDTTEKTTRSPYEPAVPHIQAILDAAARQYGQGQQGPLPYAWQNFLGNPASPGAGADPTYGGGGPGLKSMSSPAVNWQGKPREEVRAAKMAKREARQARQAGPAGAGGAQPGGGAPGAPGASQGGFQPQSGPFGYSQGLRDFLMQQYLGGGIGGGGYQPALNYITSLLGGQNQNPYLSQVFDRASSYQSAPSYFSKWLNK